LGYRPSIVTGWLSADDTRKYAAVWVRDGGTAGLEFLSAGEFRHRIAPPPTDAFPVWLNGVGHKTSRSYAVIWGQPRPGSQWTITTSEGAMEYQLDFDTQRRRGFRLQMLNAD
jgi:hypothetical protein